MSLASLAATHHILIERPKTGRDSSGGVLKTFHTLAPFHDVVGSLQPISAHEQYALAQRKVYASHRFYTATDLTDLRRDDRLKDKKTGRHYLVVYAADMAGRGHGWKVTLSEDAP